MTDRREGSERRRSNQAALDLLLALVLAAAPLIAAWTGSVAGVRRLLTDDPLRVILNLGPGDGPYVSGFHPQYEIQDKVATHWSTYQAEIALPLEVEGGPMELTYRFDRVHVQTAVVQVYFGRDRVDEFTRGGGGFQVRSAPVFAREGEPFRLGLRVDSHERKNQGLKLDWVSLELGEAGRVRLTGGAAARPALLVALLFALLRFSGWGRRAVLLAAPVSLGAAVGLAWDPWTTHRLLTGLPEALAVVGLAGVGLGRWLIRRGTASPEAVRTLVALAAGTFLLRGLAVNHPDFYYPDLRTHAKLVGVVRDAGLDMVRSPAQHIWDHGVWRTEAYGRTYAFPYTPAFHLPFALLPVSYDLLLTVMKLAAAALSIVPLVLLWAVARRLGAAPLGVVLMALIPTYTSRLTFAFLPALLGHAVDVAFVFWLVSRLDRIGERRVWMFGSLLVAACQLAYVSGVVNSAVFVTCLAAFVPWDRPEGRGRRALTILGMGLAGSLVSVLVYYRDFLGMVFDLVPRVLAGEPGSASRYPVRAWGAVILERTGDFFDTVYPALAIVGLVLLVRRGRGRGLLLAWASTYLLLLLGRARMPDLFLHGHETLFFTPLVCLAAGEALGAVVVWAGSLPLLGAWAAAGFLAVQGLLGQWRALADQLGNAL